MKCKYNIALIPRAEKNSVIKYSHFLADIADSYLLGERSLPHVTLYQFDANESEIKSIWNEVCDKLNITSINLVFKKFSCITFDKSIFWVSLLPDNIYTLLKIHTDIANIINHPIKSNYDPHMTLINTKDSLYKNLIDDLAKIYSPIKDDFELGLGRSDEVGQFVEMLYLQ